jgi:hypothetical protein
MQDHNRQADDQRSRNTAPHLQHHPPAVQSAPIIGPCVHYDLDIVVACAARGEAAERHADQGGGKDAEERDGPFAEVGSSESRIVTRLLCDLQEAGIHICLMRIADI